MARLVECVPNFSEGRDAATIDAIAARVTVVRGVHLLDRTSDRDHNRSVLTFAGEPGRGHEPRWKVLSKWRWRASTCACTRVSTRASGLLTSFRSCRSARRRWTNASRLRATSATRIAKRFELPVYLYARAALRPEREVLADIRRPQFEGLRELIVDARLHSPTSARHVSIQRAERSSSARGHS